jgi:hypothetical protein
MTYELPEQKIGKEVEDDSNNYESRQKARNKQELNDAYDAYVRREHLSEHKLFQRTYKFFYNKFYRLEIDSGFKNLGTAQTVADWAQDATFSVWEAIQRGAIRDYASLVNDVAAKRRKNALRYLVKEKKRKVSLETPQEEDDPYTRASYTDDGDYSSTENPQVYSQGLSYGQPSEYVFPVPDGLTPREQLTTMNMMAGATQEQCARMEGVASKTIQRRLKAIGERYAYEKDAAKRGRRVLSARAQAELEEMNRYHKEQSAIRMGKKPGAQDLSFLAKIVATQDENEVLTGVDASESEVAA